MNNEVQKVIYNKLKLNTTLTSLATIYDEPPTNCNYPYVLIGNEIETDSNRHELLGYSLLINLKIYTKPYGLGFYTVKQIHEEIKKTLNLKKFSMSSSNLTMVICKFNNSGCLKDDDKRIIDSFYRVIIHDNNKLSFQ